MPGLGSIWVQMFSWITSSAVLSAGEGAGMGPPQGAGMLSSLEPVCGDLFIPHLCYSDSLCSVDQPEKQRVTPFFPPLTLLPSQTSLAFVLGAARVGGFSSRSWQLSAAAPHSLPKA